jgi:hypothetical protein
MTLKLFVGGPVDGHWIEADGSSPWKVTPPDWAPKSAQFEYNMFRFYVGGKTYDVYANGDMKVSEVFERLMERYAQPHHP